LSRLIAFCTVNTSHGAHDIKRTRFGVFTAGGDAPALSATIYGIVEETNRRETEFAVLIPGCTSLVGDNVPRPTSSQMPGGKSATTANFSILIAG